VLPVFSRERRKCWPPVIRYFSSRAAFSTLRDLRLRLARASSFNDPFEFSLSIDTDDGSALDHDWFRNAMDERVRVLCTSDPERLDPSGDILMWSHYGAQHAGFRVHLNDRFLRSKAAVKWDVEYTTAIPSIRRDYAPGLDCGASETMEFEALSLALRAKGKFWSYESEVRYFFETRGCSFDRKLGVHYLRLPPSAVTRVDAGIATIGLQRRQMHRLLSGAAFAHVQFWEAAPIRGSFAIRYRRSR
jgi:hypothetical protein